MSEPIGTTSEATARFLALSRYQRTVDHETIGAELNNGVLHVTICKLPHVQPKRIDVKVL